MEGLMSVPTEELSFMIHTIVQVWIIIMVTTQSKFSKAIYSYQETQLSDIKILILEKRFYDLTTSGIDCDLHYNSLLQYCIPEYSRCNIA